MSGEKKVIRQNTCLKKGDTVIVIAGGNSKSRPNKGKTGKIVRFTGANKDRVIIEGVNMITVHQKSRGPNVASGKVQREGSIHISNVMYYAEKIKRPVRIRHKTLADGKKVRGYVSPESKEFVQIEA